jgi:hypothetical protein
MNVRNYALNDVRRRIPAAILDLAFKDQDKVVPNLRWVKKNKIESLDSKIVSEVIDDKVNVDCNLKGANQITIPLEGVPFENVSHTTRIYFVPYEHTEGRRIVTALSLNYLRYNGSLTTNATNAVGNQLLSAGRDMFKAVSSMPIVSTANCEIIGDNVILVRDTVRHLSDNMSLTVLVENSDGMSNLKPGAYKVYAKLVELATKAYIYNKLAISIDMGVLHAGMNLGKIREIIDGYADAQEQYDELFNDRWGKVAFTNDRVRMYGLVTSLMGRGR